MLASRPARAARRFSSVNSLLPLKSRVLEWFVRHWADLVSCLVGGAMVGCIWLEELRLHASTYGAYSDYWEHGAVLHALIEKPWHPSNPHLVSPASSPRFGPLSVLNALLARALGVDAVAALSGAAVVHTFAFVLGIWLFFRVYFRDRRAGLYGLLVMLGGWWEAWTFTSIYQPKVLLSVACYPWLAAFAVTLLGLALEVHVLRQALPRFWHYLLLATGVWVVFLTHQITAMMALAAWFLLALTEPDVSLKRRIAVALSAVAGCALATFWPYFSVWNLLAGGHQESGWVGQGIEAASQVTPVEALHRFYRPKELLPALGIGLLGVLALPYFFLKWRRLFVGLGVLAMLGPFALNAYVPLPLGHRFILLAIFFLHVAVVWLLLALTPGSPEFARVLDRRWLRLASLLVVWGLLATFSWHNVRRTEREWNYFASYSRRGESPLVLYSKRVAELTRKDSVVMGDTLTLWPIPTFGPKVVAARHENPFVPDAAQRILDIDTFFERRTSDAERYRIIAHYRVSHVIVKGDVFGSLRGFLDTHAQRMRLPGGYWLFALNSASLH